MNRVLVYETINRESDVRKSVKKIIDGLGGLSKIFKDYKKILIKPNFVVGRSSKSGTTTNIELIKAVIEEAKKTKKEVMVIEGGGTGYDLSNNPLAIGFNEYCRSKKVRLIDPSRDDLIKVRLDGMILKEIEISKHLKDAGIINLPKIKTHEATVLSLSIKNLMGIISKKDRYVIHTSDLDKGLADLYNYFKDQLRLNIADGIGIMEGNGPALGNVVDSKIVFASNDAAYLDYAICLYLSINPSTVKHLDYSLGGRRFSFDSLPRPIKIKKAKRSKVYYRLMDVINFLNKNFYYPMFKTDIVPIRDRIFRQYPEIIPEKIDNKTVIFCPLDNIDLKDKRLKNKDICRFCHWCYSSESSDAVNGRTFFYPRGFLEFFGPRFRKVPKIGDVSDAAAMFCPAEAIKIKDKKVHLDKRLCYKCPICIVKEKSKDEKFH